MALQASLSTQCIAIYNLDYLQAGLVYLPAGFGGMLGAKGGGWIMDWNCEPNPLRPKWCVRLLGPI